MCRAHIALQELQTIAMMLCRVTFHLSGKVVALHLDNSITKAYLCNQSGTVSPYLSRLACQVLSLTDKHGITLIPVYISTHLIVEANYLSQDKILPEWHLLPSGDSGSFSPFGPSRGGPAGIFSFHSVPALLHLGISTTSGCLGVDYLHPWMFQVRYMFPLPPLVPLVLSMFLAEHVKGQLRWLILVHTMLDGGSLAPHSSQHVGRCSSVVPHHKRSHHGCFGRPGAQGSAISAFNPLAAQ